MGAKRTLLKIRVVQRAHPSNASLQALTIHEKTATNHGMYARTQQSCVLFFTPNYTDALCRYHFPAATRSPGQGSF
jgi:hypothetical protein